MELEITDLCIYDYIRHVSRRSVVNEHPLLDKFLIEKLSKYEGFSIPGKSVLDGFSVNNIPFCIHGVSYESNGLIDMEYTKISVLGSTNDKFESVIEEDRHRNPNWNYVRAFVPLFRFYIKNMPFIKMYRYADDFYLKDAKIFLSFPMSKISDLYFERGAL